MIGFVAALEPPSFGTILAVVAAVWLLPSLLAVCWVLADRAADAWLDRHGFLPADDIHIDEAGDLTYQQLCFERWEAEIR